MSKLEIKKLFTISGKTRHHHFPCGLNMFEQLWWRFMPGTIIKVKWPTGLAVIDESMPQWDWTIGPSRYLVESADPNDHYRPYLEKNVGRQGWDWNWGWADNDVAENMLTIKIRQKYSDHAIMLALRWS